VGLRRRWSRDILQRIVGQMSAWEGGPIVWPDGRREQESLSIRRVETSRRGRFAN
jgi:hypothetical protein